MSDRLIDSARTAALAARAERQIGTGLRYLRSDPTMAETWFLAARGSVASILAGPEQITAERPAPLLSLVDEEAPEVDLDECPACLGMRPPEEG